MAFATLHPLECAAFAAGRVDGAYFVLAKPNAVEADPPRHVPSRRNDWRSLDRDEPHADASIVVPRAQASRFRNRPSAAGCVPDGPHRGFTLETKTAATYALLQKHAPTIRNAFHRVSSYALARRWFPSHRRRTRETEDEPKLAMKRDACARRPSNQCRLGDGSEDALHRFARARSVAAVRGVSMKLLRARSRVLSLPCGFRAPRPRCIRPTSTHPSSHPREPIRRVLPNILEACASCSPRGLGSTAGPLATSSVATRGAAKSAPASLDLPMREAGETRVSRHARSLRRIVMARAELVRLLPGHESTSPLTLRHHPRSSDSRLDASLRFFEDGLDRFHRRHRDAPTTSATRKAFPR